MTANWEICRSARFDPASDFAILAPMAVQTFTSVAGRPRFHTTSWTVLREAGGGAGTAAMRGAQEALYRSYWGPVMALLRARGLQKADAEDLAQEFFQRLLAGRRLAGVEKNGARFRVWLRKALENFVISAHRRRMSQKRGAGAEHLEIEEYHQPAGVSAEEDARRQARVFDRAWAEAIVEAAFEALEARYHADGQQRTYRVLAQRFQPGQPPASGEELAAELGVEPAAARKAAERFRRRFREAIRDRVALTVADDEDVTDEMRYLRELLT